jgi:hypothetical protein
MVRQSLTKVARRMTRLSHEADMPSDAMNACLPGESGIQRRDLRRRALVRYCARRLPSACRRAAMVNEALIFRARDGCAGWSARATR